MLGPHGLALLDPAGLFDQLVQRGLFLARLDDGIDDQPDDGGEHREEGEADEKGIKPGHTIVRCREITSVRKVLGTNNSKKVYGINFLTRNSGTDQPLSRSAGLSPYHGCFRTSIVVF